ncbi:hypothetical protein [Sphingomonas cavernae]|uniref:Uncharacterized protein n=1 Tax=Sphingomonas cavernae TaxID=2320861 RepID=A0A418WLA2_9SPHN|nr:hypothetical protein [Sphingomonas cavernae]RJF90732.1 hypothetical protein D3876_11050 [Sphingomonas cavernae]
MTTIVVQNYTELKGALVPANQGATIKVKAGDYNVTEPLVVPDGATLEGEGRMQAIYAASNWWPGSPQSKLQASPGWEGDILRLGNGSRITGLTISDVAGRKGNLVAVISTATNDRISATIDRCELINPNSSGALITGPAAGPTGRGLVVLTLNPLDASPPAPHEGAVVSVQMTRSVIRSPGNGSGVFAINFAPRARVIVRLSRNMIGGGLDANGGVSRPYPVVGSETVIFSDRNMYQSDGTAAAAPTGWLLHGGSNAPFASFVAPFTNGNTLTLKSYRDSISGFAVGIRAAGGWRPSDPPGMGTVNFNCADLELTYLGITSLAADLVLVGAVSGSPAAPGAPRFTPGDDNHLRVTFNMSGGSSEYGSTTIYANRYQDSAWIDGGTLPQPGSGNSLEVFGDDQETSLLSVKPQPPADFSRGPAFSTDGP